MTGKAVAPRPGPLLTDSGGNEVPFFSVGENQAPTNFYDVTIEVFADNTLSMSYSNVMIFDHVPLTGYSPITGGSFTFAARTGGANEHAWIDNLAIFANFTPGPAVITLDPVDASVTETLPVTFSIQVEGTPPYSVQWYSNDIAIAEATGLTYTIPATTLDMSGAQYYAEVTNPDSTTAARSATATLNVNPGLLLRSASTHGSPNQVFVDFSKPVQITPGGATGYTLSGANILDQAYGASQNQVVLTTDPLSPQTAYDLTVSGVTGQDSSTLVPDPSMASFFQGFGQLCTDFGSGPPDGSLLGGSAAIGGTNGTDGILHLTDDGQVDCGTLYVSNRTGGAVLDRLQTTWKSRIGGPLLAHADGYSINWGADLPTGCAGITAEEGAGTGVSFTVDTWDNGDGPDTGIEIKWKGTRLAFQHIDRQDTGTGDFSPRMSLLTLKPQCPVRTGYVFLRQSLHLRHDHQLDRHRRQRLSDRRTRRR